MANNNEQGVKVEHFKLMAACNYFAKGFKALGEAFGQRESSEAQRAANKANGAKGAKARWESPIDTKKPIRRPERLKQEDMDDLYANYPRKQGKSQGYKKLATLDKDSGILVRQAILNYTKHCENNNTELQYVMHFGTFMNQWRDWVDGGDLDLSKATGKTAGERLMERVAELKELEKKNGDNVS